MMKSLRLSAPPILFFGLVGGLILAQELPKIQEDVVVRWWLVPVYAMNENGSPALGLKAGDFEVFIDDKPIPYFDLHIKEFQVPEAFQGSAPAGFVRRFEKKMVFLVFDSAFSSYVLLEKAKKVAETMITQEGEGVQFIALSIEPFSGLEAIVGPTSDRDLVARKVDRYVVGKKAHYLRNSAVDSTSIRNVYPSGDMRNPDELATPRRRTTLLERMDTVEKRRIASVYTRSLMSLNLILGYFKDNSKIIYLFSCGIPQNAMEWHSESDTNSSGSAEPGVNLYVNITPDHFNRQALVDAARFFNRNGSLLFLINPAGTRLALHDQDSGEQSLRILAGESGGRYYDGPEKDIANEITAMETAYYEISFPDSDEYQGPDLDIEIRPRNPEIDIYTVKRVSRGREYGQMTRLERQVLVLNLLAQGPYAQAKLKIVEAEFQRSRREGGGFQFSINLPAEISQSAWDIFKVWRNLDNGQIMIEEDHFLAGSPQLTVDMRQRKGFRHELVLVDERTGTTLVIQE